MQYGDNQIFDKQLTALDKYSRDLYGVESGTYQPSTILSDIDTMGLALLVSAKTPKVEPFLTKERLNELLSQLKELISLSEPLFQIKVNAIDTFYVLDITETAQPHIEDMQKVSEFEAKTIDNINKLEKRKKLVSILKELRVPSTEDPDARIRDIVKNETIATKVNAVFYSSRVIDFILAKAFVMQKLTEIAILDKFDYARSIEKTKKTTVENKPDDSQPTVVNTSDSEGQIYKDAPDEMTMRRPKDWPPTSPKEQ